jgi:hypothetical protein
MIGSRHIAEIEAPEIIPIIIMQVANRGAVDSTSV